MATEYQGQCFLKTHAIFMKRNAIRISCLQLRQRLRARQPSPS